MIKKILKSVYSNILIFGIDLRKIFRSVRGIPSFIKSYFLLKNQKNKVDSFSLGYFKPCLDDKYDKSGMAKGHYYHQDLLVASKIFKNKPLHHIDVGSRVDGFVAHVASFRKISVIDIRKLDSSTENISFLQADMMASLPEVMINSCDSLSCLHALEHFGLGRYGDKIDWNGHRSGFNNLLLLLKQGGRFYFSVPIGNQRIEFNAHRVFSIKYLLGLFEGKLQLVDFSYVDDNGDLHQSAYLDETSVEDNFGCSFGCGIFELIKTY